MIEPVAVGSERLTDIVGELEGETVFVRMTLIATTDSPPLYNLNKMLVTVLSLRFAARSVSLAEVARLGVRFVLPCALCCVVGTYFWAFGSQSPILAAAHVPLSCALFFFGALCVLHVVLRVMGQLAGERPRSAVNPWL